MLVRALVRQLADADTHTRLSDQALVDLSTPGVRHLLISDRSRLAGYAQLAGRSAEVAAEGPVLELLVEAVIDDVGPGVRVWSHDDLALTASLRAHGLVPLRRLHQLRRRSDPTATAADAGQDAADLLPAGIVLDTFVVGRDEQQWLRVNAAAFAGHPEQGGWRLADLRAREQETWFDPAGLFVARRGPVLLGFHWTKVHPDGRGEVYVIAVDPAAQGLGLGRVLLNRGLAHLARAGCPEVLLYVDETNAGAMAMYAKAGFTRHELHVQWMLPEPQSTARTGSESKT